MPELISQNIPTIVVAAIVLLAVVLIVANMVRARKKGGCGSACSGCPNAGICHAHVPKDR